MCCRTRWGPAVWRQRRPEADPDHGQADTAQKKHPRRLPDGTIMLIRRIGGLPARADPETQRVSPPGQGLRPDRAPSCRCREGQRPQGTGRVPAWGFGPRRRVKSAPQGRGNGPGQTARGLRKMLLSSGRRSMRLAGSQQPARLQKTRPTAVRDVLLAGGARYGPWSVQALQECRRVCTDGKGSSRNRRCIGRSPVNRDRKRHGHGRCAVRSVPLPPSGAPGHSRSDR